MNNQLTEKGLIRLMRDTYKNRLLEVMAETDLIDKQGNVVIQKGLKVRHKDSQYEYTVDSVMQDPDGKVSVKLRNPDVGRIDPADSTEVMAEDDLLAPPPPPEDAPVQAAAPGEEIADDDVFVVDQEEFEKEYEVK